LLFDQELVLITWDSVIFSNFTDNVDHFWESIGGDLEQKLRLKYQQKFEEKQKSYKIPSIKTFDDIKKVFTKKSEIWYHLFPEEPSKNIVLFFDELDTLLPPKCIQVCNISV